MALNLIVQLKGREVDWAKLNRSLVNVSFGSVEFFPIPDYLLNNENYIGISILNSALSIQDVEFLRSKINFLFSEGHKVFELYGSTELVIDNFGAFTDKFLKTG